MSSQEPTALRTPPVVSAERFTFSLDDGRYLIYAPLRKVAFVSNAAVVNAMQTSKRAEWIQWRLWMMT